MAEGQGGGFKQKRSSELTRHDVPTEVDAWSGPLAQFALTFDGYRFLGDDLGPLSGQVREIHSRNPKVLEMFNTTGLRALLFMAQRSARWLDEEEHTDQYTRDLVALIRKRLK